MDLTGAAGVWAYSYFNDYGDLRRQVRAVVAHSVVGNHRIICSVPHSVAGLVFDQCLRLCGGRPVLMAPEDFRRWWGCESGATRRALEQAVSDALREGWQGLTVIIDADYTGMQDRLATIETGGLALGGRLSFFSFLGVLGASKLSLSLAVQKRLDLRPVLYMDRDSWEVEVLGRPVDLSPAEFDLLLLLARIPGRVVRYGELQIGTRGGAGRRTLAAHIYNLRKKIEPDPAHPALVKTVRGVGYRFALP
ncbi:MAG: winged helix-turn-helix domain-containing protein [Thermoanaerobacterales bacterium]|nr:winged helix-turn-helix domain-containing protein [Bacillota bacterium]MDI6906091.1 winged helix-turn-helix domain-containing protein [Thermoanaerobacterales bacterium]